jgi:Fe-S cluster assembly protein SufD
MPISLDAYAKEITIVVQSGAQLVIHDFLDLVKTDSMYRSIKVTIQENAHVTFIHDQNSESIEQHISIDIGNNSTLSYYLLLTGGSKMKLDINIRGQRAHADIRGAWLLSGQEQVSMQVNQHHYAPYSTSTLDIRTILQGHAQALYKGNIFIDKNAHKTNASQQNKNIILSDRARATSIPNIEVLTNDVQCAHGSAVGQLDKEQLLYVQSRGLSHARAQELLLHGFLNGVLKDQLLLNRADNWLRSSIKKS